MKKKIFTLATLTLLLLTFVSCSDDRTKDITFNSTSFNGGFKITTSLAWKPIQNSNFELQIVNNDIGSMGFYLYDVSELDEGSEPVYILDSQINDIMANTDPDTNTKLENRQVINSDDKKITTEIRSASFEGDIFYYYFSFIEFNDNADRYIFGVQTSLPEDFSPNRIEVDEMLKSIKLTDGTEQTY